MLKQIKKTVISKRSLQGEDKSGRCLALSPQMGGNLWKLQLSVKC